MKLLIPNIPKENIVVNSFYDSKEPEFLTQDLLLVRLPLGKYIDISWSPEHYQNGCYIVTLFIGHNNIYQTETKDSQEALKIVEKFFYEN